MKNKRLIAVLIFILIFGLAIISRLFYIQVLNRKFYQAEALGQQAGFKEITGSRGQIFFTDSQASQGVQSGSEIKSLAINRDSFTLFAMANEIKDKEIFASALAENIEETKKFVFEEIDGQSGYTIIKKNLSQENINKLKTLNLAGLYWENNPARFYPQEELAAKVSGFVGGDGSGQYGLEGYYNDQLKGKAGVKEVKIGLGLALSENQDTLSGSDIYLTIDPNIQFQAEALLKTAKEDVDIDSGQIIVIKPDSGRILAMADFPFFNPNEYGKVKNLEIFQNGSAQKLFEPGSVLKPFTMAIGLNEGKITPNTTFTDEGFVKIGKDIIYNFAREKYGLQTMAGVLEKSINTGAVFVQQKVSHNTFFNYMDNFGFNRKTGIDLQGEVASKNELLKNGPDVEYATAAFGQGIEITPMQLVRGFCIFANKGRLVRPYVTDKIVSGKDEMKTNPAQGDQIITPEVAEKITTMMAGVVEKGFGKSAGISGYYIAGKTGTAEVPKPNGGGYEENKTIQSFIGYAPAYNPKFLILVKLDNPKVPKSSLSAAPIFKKMAQYIINYWQIPPDYDIKSK